jgi:hypothetical protein
MTTILIMTIAKGKLPSPDARLFLSVTKSDHQRLVTIRDLVRVTIRDLVEHREGSDYNWKLKVKARGENGKYTRQVQIML